MNDVLILSNGTKIELEPGASLDSLRVVSQTKEEMVVTWNEFTQENLLEVTIQNGDGVTVGKYDSLVFVSETSVIRVDGSILTKYCFRVKTDIEKRLDALEESQTIQDLAIEDLGTVTSDLATSIVEQEE